MVVIGNLTKILVSSLEPAFYCLSLYRVPGDPTNPKMPANLKSQDVRINFTPRLN